MPTDMFCFDAGNKWVHVYTITNLLDIGQLPISGQFVDTTGMQYTRALVNGKYQLTGPTAAANPNVRLDAVFANITTAVANRLACQLLSETERQKRLAKATAELDAVRGAVGLGPRFTAMKAHQFGHPLVQSIAPLPLEDPASTRGGWLHNLFCH